VNDVWSSAAEKYLVEQTRLESVSFTVGEGEYKNSFGEAVDDS
jgi:hypothetical protein